MTTEPIDPPLTAEELQAAARRQSERQAGEMGVDWCTHCGATAADGAVIENDTDRPQTQMGLCQNCRRRDYFVDLGERYANIRHFGLAVEELRASHTEAEIRELFEWVMAGNNPADGYSFSRPEGMQVHPDDYALQLRRYAADDVVREQGERAAAAAETITAGEGR